MKNDLISLLIGTLFGLGLCVARMVDPAVILAFLDVTGAWDPALLWVMGGALGVSFVSYRFILRRGKPLFADNFDLPQKTQLDRELIAGAVLFGIGWGLVGVCPGPAITSLAFGMPKLILFTACMLIGMALKK